LTIVVSNEVKLGNYAITIKVSGENVPEKVAIQKIMVIP